jgi:mannose-6-phosphate isomerase
VIGLGLVHAVDKPALRQAALDGSIEALVDWRPVKAGEAYYSPAGTVHAIGPGLQLVEVQQNADVTYRLYDYGRPRELHLDAAIEAADPRPYEAPEERGGTIVAEGDKLAIERWRGPSSAALLAGGSRPVWLIPLRGSGSLDGTPVAAGEVWLVEEDALLVLAADADVLVARTCDEPPLA